MEKGVLLKMGYLTAVVMAMHSSAWGTRALSFQNELPLLTALLHGSTARSQLLQPLLLSHFSQKKKKHHATTTPNIKVAVSGKTSSVSESGLQGSPSPFLLPPAPEAGDVPGAVPAAGMQARLFLAAPPHAPHGPCCTAGPWHMARDTRAGGWGLCGVPQLCAHRVGLADLLYLLTAAPTP